MRHSRPEAADPVRSDAGATVREVHETKSEKKLRMKHEWEARFVEKMSRLAPLYFGWRIKPTCEEEVKEETCTSCPKGGITSKNSGEDVRGDYDAQAPPITLGKWPVVHFVMRVIIVFYFIVVCLLNAYYFGFAAYFQMFVADWADWAFVFSFLYFVVIICATVAAYFSNTLSKIDSNVASVPRQLPMFVCWSLRISSTCLHLALAHEVAMTIIFWMTAEKSVPMHPAQILLLLQTHIVTCLVVAAEFFCTRVPLFGVDVWVLFWSYVLFIASNFTFFAITDGSLLHGSQVPWDGEHVVHQVPWLRWFVSGGFILFGSCIVMHIYRRWQEKAIKPPQAKRNET